MVEMVDKVKLKSAMFLQPRHIFKFFIKILLAHECHSISVIGYMHELFLFLDCYVCRGEQNN